LSPLLKNEVFAVTWIPEKDRPVITDLLILHVKHPEYGYREITIKLRGKWYMQLCPT
jgi:hypothetical protein